MLMFKNTTINLSGKSTHNFFILKNFRENIKIDLQKWASTSLPYRSWLIYII